MDAPEPLRARRARPELKSLLENHLNQNGGLLITGSQVSFPEGRLLVSKVAQSASLRAEGAASAPKGRDVEPTRYPFSLY